MKEKTVYYSIIEKKSLDNTEETQQARNLLRKMLKKFQITPPEISISTNGKPYFKNSNIYFNYSHSKNHIACAISYYDVGVDIEETSRVINDDISKKYLDGEKNNLKRIEKWVKKEAYSKLQGLGLQIHFQKLKIEKITTQNFFLDENDYMCSIYCAGNDVKFKKIIITESEEI